MPTPAFADLLTLIDDRSAALRAAASDAGQDAAVPGCPDWSVGDLVAHLGAVQLFWAAVVTAGSPDAPPGEDKLGDRTPGADLIGWSAASTDALLGALREAGQDRPCWAWWEGSGAPLTSGAIARHQVQEAAVHAFDAQEAAGRAEPLPPVVAADGIGEFVTVAMASLGPWPHRPAAVELAAADGTAWRISLTGAGAIATDAGEPAAASQRDAGQPEPDARLRGTASDLVLALYGRHTERGVAVEGDRALADALLTWPENE
jgi:uncharacterized protein (TIGR03083 family)